MLKLATILTDIYFNKSYKNSLPIIKKKHTKHNN